MHANESDHPVHDPSSSEAPNAAFTLREASKRYGRTTALHPTSLEVPSGRTTVLIGPSGCGKSTLLRLLNGLIHPTRGSIHFRGTQLDPATIDALRLNMGYVIQDGGLFPHLTAERNVTLLARTLGWARPKQRARVAELAKLTNLPTEMLRRYPTQLSGGQRQRVSLMRALMLDPEVLLLDEPLGALDPMIRFQLQEDLRGIFRRLRKTVVMVTHDLAEAAFFADNIVLMSAGQIVQRGSYEDLTERPATPFVTEFVQAQRGIHAPSATGDAA